jgi:hypothetical protein
MYLLKGGKKTHHFISSSTVLTPNPCSYSLGLSVENPKLQLFFPLFITVLSVTRKRRLAANLAGGGRHEWLASFQK